MFCGWFDETEVFSVDDLKIFFSLLSHLHNQPITKLAHKSRYEPFLYLFLKTKLLLNIFGMAAANSNNEIRLCIFRFKL